MNKIHIENCKNLTILNLCLLSLCLWWLLQGILKGEVSTVDLLFDWFRLVCFANKNKNCQPSYSWFQTSQTGGQRYGDTSPFSIPWLLWYNHVLIICLSECCCHLGANLKVNSHKFNTPTQSFKESIIGAMTFSITIFRIMTLSIKGSYLTVSINDTQCNNVLPLCWVWLCWVSRFYY